jgi:hypothetical protein
VGGLVALQLDSLCPNILQLKTIFIGKDMIAVPAAALTALFL